MEVGHSPLPWALDEDGFICDANGAEIMHHYHDEAVIEAPDSAFIVRACNAHEILVGALRQIAAGNYHQADVVALEALTAAGAA